MNVSSAPSGPKVGSSPVAIPRWKRTLDLFFILLTLPLVLPLSIFIGVLIWIVSPGPILFRQARVGLMGRRFMCLKFRTMFVAADTSGHQNHLGELIGSNLPLVKLDSRGDSRIIPFGCWLRSSGLDELPQLINVLFGEMSLVGPRPCLAYECEKYLPWHWQRFDTLPGLTGLWQVSGKNKTTFSEMMQLDVDYAHRKNLWLDLLIIMKTPMVVMGQVWEVLAGRLGLLRRRAGETKLRTSVGTVTSHPSDASGAPRSAMFSNKNRKNYE
jgi:lipopolysaccharide/colanic/teichoic acid biosynthesis glycosyltransferase